MPQWRISELSGEIVRHLVTALDIHPITAQVLVNRGITAAETATAFFTPRFHHLHDPYTLPDMPAAVDRVVAAIRNGERICLFGDYDTDGVTGTALGVRFFRACGVPVDYWIPHRLREGYGLTVAAVERLATEQAPQLLITIDNGATAVEAVAAARARGINVVVTDHHEVGAVLPAAVAVVNPKRRDTASAYPFPGLCGVGVFFKFCTAIRHRLRAEGFFSARPEPHLAQWLDLVAVGTIADVVPLRDENRVFCTFGLKTLRHTKNLGLQALCRVAGLDGARIAPRAVAFQIAPRLNAAGRLADATLAVELLTTESAPRAEELATTLNTLNGERQGVEERMLKDCHRRLADQPPDRYSVVAAAPDWPAGVVGIIASRIASAYGKPTVLISTEGGVGRGSARGVGNFPLLEALAACGAHLERFGGHARAAGITIRPEAIPAFAAAFDAAVRERWEPADSAAQLQVDAEVTAEELTPRLVAELQQLAPYGEGNPEPVLCTRDVGVKQRRIVGNNHLKLTVHNAMITFDAIGFRLGDHPAGQAHRLDLAFVPEENEWNGLRSIQLKLLDLKAL